MSAELNLKDSKVCLIVPLSNYIYQVSLNGWVSRNCRDKFEDTLDIFNNIIKKNQETLKSKTISEKNWWTSRERIDRELGKITSEVALDIIDQNSDSNRDTANILICSYCHYTSFPIENLCSLSKFEGVYRIPSVRYLIMQEQVHKQRVNNLSQAFYSVNSKNDLPQTEVMLYKLKELYPSWKGEAGKEVPFAYLRKILSNSETLYIYMGHGSGFGHIKPTDLLTLKPRAAMLLFGCDSIGMNQENS